MVTHPEFRGECSHGILSGLKLRVISGLTCYVLFSVLITITNAVLDVNLPEHDGHY
jgi:hypothetical protein